MPRPWLTLAIMFVGCLPAGEEVDDDGDAPGATSATDIGAAADSGAGADVTTTTAPIPDVTTLDTSPSDAGPPTPVACYEGPLGATGVVVFDERVISMTPVVLDGGALFGARARSLAEGERASDLVAHDLLTGTERIAIAMEHLLFVTDARDGALLVMGADLDAGRATLRYTDPELEAPAVLVDYPAPSVDGLSLLPWPFGWTGPVRRVEPGVATWNESEATPSRPGLRVRVRALVAGTVATVWEADSDLGLESVLRAGRVAWRHAYQGPAQLWLADLQSVVVDPPRLVTDDSVQDFALTDDALWWIAGGYEGGRVMRLDLTTDAVTEAHAGPCLTLASDATRIVTVCGEAMVRRASFGLIEGGQPVVIDGAHTLVLPSEEGRALAGMAVEGARVIWGEYPPLVLIPGVSCEPGPGDATLKMALLEPPTIGSVHAVATLGVGCWCCSNTAYWPEPDIRLTAEALAWNYPITSATDTRHDQLAALGWIVFDAACAAPAE